MISNTPCASPPPPPLSPTPAFLVAFVVVLFTSGVAASSPACSLRVLTVPHHERLTQPQPPGTGGTITDIVFRPQNPEVAWYVVNRTSIWRWDNISSSAQSVYRQSLGGGNDDDNDKGIQLIASGFRNISKLLVLPTPSTTRPLSSNTEPTDGVLLVQDMDLVKMVNLTATTSSSSLNRTTATTTTILANLTLLGIPTQSTSWSEYSFQHFSITVTDEHCVRLVSLLEPNTVEPTPIVGTCGQPGNRTSELRSPNFMKMHTASFLGQTSLATLTGDNGNERILATIGPATRVLPRLAGRDFLLQPPSSLALVLTDVFPCDIPSIDGVSAESFITEESRLPVETLLVNASGVSSVRLVPGHLDSLTENDTLPTVADPYLRDACRGAIQTQGAVDLRHNGTGRLRTALRLRNGTMRVLEYYGCESRFSPSSSASSLSSSSSTDGERRKPEPLLPVVITVVVLVVVVIAVCVFIGVVICVMRRSSPPPSEENNHTESGGYTVTTTSSGGTRGGGSYYYHCDPYNYVEEDGSNSRQHRVNRLRQSTSTKC